MLEIDASAPSDEPLPYERLVTKAMPWPALPDLTSGHDAQERRAAVGPSRRDSSITSQVYISLFM